MAVVKPFKAWRYNQEKIKNLSEVVVPPYDVIAESELQDMQKLNAYNYSQVILSQGENKHKAAAKRLQQWQKENVLVHEEAAGFYLYQQDFELSAQELFCQKSKKNKLSRYGFFAKVQVEEYKNHVILPHEKTFSKYKQDRYELMQEVQGNPEPVFLGYDSNFLTGDEFFSFTKKSRLIADYSDRYGVKHKLWFLSDKDSIERIEKSIKSEKLYILDGHHRYETALKFYQDQPSEKTKYVLANVCAFKQEGTVILPTHRLLASLDSVLLEKYFVMQSVSDLNELEKHLMKSTQISFGLKKKGEKGYTLLQVRPEFADKIKNEQSYLDLDFLHQNILDSQKDSKVFYVRSLPEFEERLSVEDFSFGFLIRPNTSDDVIAKATHDLVMPHKSTFFYPKIPSGLVIHLFE